MRLLNIVIKRSDWLLKFQDILIKHCDWFLKFLGVVRIPEIDVVGFSNS